MNEEHPDDIKLMRAAAERQAATVKEITCTECGTRLPVRADDDSGLCGLCTPFTLTLPAPETPMAECEACGRAICPRCAGTRHGEAFCDNCLYAQDDREFEDYDPE
jgi:hypothetical protein